MWFNFFVSETGNCLLLFVIAGDIFINTLP